MKFLRSVADYTQNDHKINAEIREDLNIYNVKEKIHENRQQWHNHICRMHLELQSKRKRFKKGSAY